MTEASFINRFGIIDFDKLEENNQIKAKSAMKGCPDMRDTYSAFANTFGGRIILGAKENEDHTFSISPIEDPEKILREIHSVLENRNKVSMNVLVEKDISLLIEARESIIVINVPMAGRHSKQIFINGDVFRGTYKRGHGGDCHCTKDEVKAMMADSLDSRQNVPFCLGI